MAGPRAGHPTRRACRTSKSMLRDHAFGPRRTSAAQRQPSRPTPNLMAGPPAGHPSHRKHCESRARQTAT